MAEQIVAQIVLDVARDADDDHAHPELEHALDQRQADEQTGEAQQPGQAEGVRQRVNGGADHQRLRRAGDILEHQRTHAQRQPPR